MKSETEKMFFLYESQKLCSTCGPSSLIVTNVLSDMVSHIAKNCTSIVRYMDLYSVVSIIMSSKQPKFV